MKVITTYVTSTKNKFVVIEGNSEAVGKFYGTIPSNEIDENGRLKRNLNGLTMMIEKTVDKAIKSREEAEVMEAKTIEYMTKHNCSKSEAFMEILKSL